jgi:DinB family protein
VSVSRRGLMRWQFDLTWSLLDLHLERLRPEDFLWEPATRCWTMQPDGEGWAPDWQDPEPEPAPIPTIGWVTWHIGWWWTVTIDHAPGWAPRNRGEIRWPGEGPATIGWLRGLRRDWLAVLEHLTDADLDVTAPFPWHNNPERTVAHMVSWVNSELMKNTAEIGQLRLLHAATAE